MTRHGNTTGARQGVHTVRLLPRRHSGDEALPQIMAAFQLCASLAQGEQTNIHFLGF